MATKHHSLEPIFQLLRQAEEALVGGQDVAQVCRALGVSQQKSYRWRKEFGGVRTDQDRRLKDQERENARRKKLVAEAELDTATLREAASGNVRARRSGLRRSRT